MNAIMVMNCLSDFNKNKLKLLDELETFIEHDKFIYEEEGLNSDPELTQVKQKMSIDLIHGLREKWGQMLDNLDSPPSTLLERNNDIHLLEIRQSVLSDF